MCVHDSQSLSQSGQRSHHNVESDVSACLEVGYRLTAAAHALGNPFLGATARLALSAEQGSKVFWGIR